mmetsp:Transcript_26621/g.82909  ORF Transcript_26621/g.82909 Transcript_26621/m.82909 type:complete len:139 (+) Transcript_26621:359-775(+)
MVGQDIGVPIGGLIDAYTQREQARRDEPDIGPTFQHIPPNADAAARSSCNIPGGMCDCELTAFGDLHIQLEAIDHAAEVLSMAFTAWLAAESAPHSSVEMPDPKLLAWATFTVEECLEAKANAARSSSASHSSMGQRI